ncbi:MAG: hypothetical protein ACLFQK_12300 [Fibrobacterota bacterium]
MPKYSIAFISPESDLVHEILDADNREEALKDFFYSVRMLSYSNDEDGFYYFKEDFNDRSSKDGSIIEI